METTKPGGGTLAAVARNFRVTLMGRLTLKALQLAMAIWVIRRLGQADYGRYNLLTAYYLFYQVLSDLGTGSLLLQRVGEGQEAFRSLFCRVFRLRLALAGVSVGISAVATLLLGYEPELTFWMVVFALPNVLLFNVNQSCICWYQGQFEMPRVVRGDVAGQASALVLMAGALALGGGYAELFACLIGGELIRSAVYFWALPVAPLGTATGPYEKTQMREILHWCWPLAVMTVLQILFVRVDVVMLSKLQGHAAVGLYGVAQKLCQILSLIPEAFFPLVFPVLARFARADPEKGILFFRLSFKYLALYVAPLGACIGFYSPWVVSLLFGPAFAPSAATLSIHVWTTLGACLYTITNYLMISLGLERVNMAYLGGAVAFSVAGNALLQPHLAQNGAAMTALGAYLVYMLLCMASSRARQFVGPALRSLLAPVTLAAVVLVVPWGTGLGPIAGSCAYVAVFALLAWPLLLSSTDDRTVVDAILRPKDAKPAAATGPAVE
ncbi:MAG: flippase [Candidatus Riflebacteria bacterium]|nr:flippase [Candidatus Riflebacteria bacterium]